MRRATNSGFGAAFMFRSTTRHACSTRRGVTRIAAIRFRDGVIEIGADIAGLQINDADV